MKARPVTLIPGDGIGQEVVPEGIRVLDRLAAASGVDLRTHGTVSDADTIRDTAVAQPLIVAASLISFAAVLNWRIGQLNPNAASLVPGRGSTQIQL